MDPSKLSAAYRIPVGTQVVLRRDVAIVAHGPEAGAHRCKPQGAVGRVESAPQERDGEYVVRFADDCTVVACQDDLAERRLATPDVEFPARDVEEYREYLIYRVLIGSSAFGLAEEGSDRDERGVFLPPAAWTWSLQPVPDQVEFKVTPEGAVVHSNQAIEADDFCWFELEKFVRLALKANPNALEILYVDDPFVLLARDAGVELRAIRGAFLSKHIYQTYSGYVLSQFRRMKRAEEKGKSYRPKHAMHLMRLLYTGIEAMQGNGIRVDVSDRRDELLAIKHDPPPLDAIVRRATLLAEELQREYERTALPEGPDLRAVDDFLVRARSSMT